MTPAQIVSLASAMQDVSSALLDVAQGNPTIGDFETIADNVLTEALSFVPGASAFAQFAPAVVALIVAGYASGAIKGDPNPIADAQSSAGASTHGRWIER